MRFAEAVIRSQQSAQTERQPRLTDCSFLALYYDHVPVSEELFRDGPYICSVHYSSSQSERRREMDMIHGS